jgi:hypothetical protein
VAFAGGARVAGAFVSLTYDFLLLIIMTRIRNMSAATARRCV